MNKLKVCYPTDKPDKFRVYPHGRLLSYQETVKLGYEIYERSECELYASHYHHPDCSCKYCLYGRESLPGNEY